MKRETILATLLMVICILSLLVVGCGNNEDTESGNSGDSSNTNSDGFDTALRFVVASDTHVSSVADASAVRLAKLFQSAYAYAEEQAYKDLDAVVVVGDLTNYGQQYEYKAWKSVVTQNIKKDTELITVMGNHEYYGALDNLPVGIDNYSDNMDSELNKHVVINGYHFIGISTYGEGDYADDLEWLEENLASAAADSPDKPIITFQHHHIKNTVYTSSEWYAKQSEELDEIYSQYSQVLNFSGHSHGPINNPTSCYQKDYTLFGTGTLSYFEMASGMTYGTKPPNADQAAQFYIVEVSTDNRVRVLPYNLLTDDFFKTADGTKQLVYEIDNLKDKTTWKYTDARAEESGAPAFTADAEITVSEIGKYSAVITVPQASDDDCVYSYNIVCTPTVGITKEYNYFSEYYFEPMPKTLTFNLSALDADTDYTVAVYPIDVFGNKGDCIETTFTTAAAVSYTSENPVNFVGTFTNFDSIITPITSSDSLAYGGKVSGDIYVGTWNSNAGDSASAYEIVNNAGYNGSKGLAVWSGNMDNQGLYIFGTDENKNTVTFPSMNYLRVWVDFSEVEFRKASFGLVAPSGDLYTTDESDGRADLEFYYLAEGSTEWVTYTHGSDDGCFGTAQGTPMNGFKGWLAFPVKDFTYRWGTGSESGSMGESYSQNNIAGVYMFWDYDDNIAAGTKFVIDEVQLVKDYTVFADYE